MANGTMIGETRQIPVFTWEEGQRRWKKIRELMYAQEIDCLLIAGNSSNNGAGYGDIRYVSNAAPWFDEQYIVFPLQGDPILIVFSMNTQYHTAKTSWMQVTYETPVKGVHGKTFADMIADYVKHLGVEGGTLGLNNKYLWPMYAVERLRELLPYARFPQAGEILRTIRIVKSPAELEYVRKACEIADKGWEALRDTAKPGVNEYELAAAMEYAMVKNGAEVGTLAMFNSKQWPDGWGFPLGGTYRKLQKGDIIINEITPCYGNYWGQLVRPISLGTPPDDYLELLNIHKGIYKIAWENTRAGNHTQEITDQAGKWGMEQGRPLSVADPCLQNIDDIAYIPEFMGELKAGMVTCIHPVTVPPQADVEARRNHRGHMIGDTNIVTDGKPECLTKLPFDVTII